MSTSENGDAVDDLAGEASDGWFLPVYEDTLGPALAGETELLSILTLVGIGLVAWQLIVLINQFRRSEPKKRMAAMLIGGILASSALIFPTVMIPLYFTVIDAVIGLVLSLAASATGG